MKQNDWTQNLRSRLGDRKSAVPDDLWDKIEQRLNAEHPVEAKRRIGTVRLVAWALSAAAAAALLVVAGYHANEDTIEHLADRHAGGTSKAVAKVSEDENANSSAVDNGNAASQLKETMASSSRVSANGENPVLLAENRVADAVEGSMLADGSGNKEQSVVEQGGESAPRSAHHPQRYTLPKGTTYVGSHDSRSSRWSVGASTNGSFVSSRNADMPGVRTLKASSALLPEAGHDELCGQTMYTSSNAALLSNYKEVRHHSLPVSFGLSVGYALSERLSLTTGIVYTYAASDLTKSSGGDDIVENQRLHYLGVPVGVKYKVWGSGIVHTYATAGAQADFNVSAVQATGDMKTNIDKDRVQFSANAAAGVQVDVARSVGVYAEPGVKYYFNNHSDVSTIFKDKPWNFNLQIGLRVDF